MKRVVLSAVAGLALGTAAMAADLPVYKAPPPAAPAYTSPCDASFGVTFTSDYVLRGISQTLRKWAVQGYIEPSCNINEHIQVYAGVWGSSILGFANAEFDLYGGVRLSWDPFSVDIGYVYYKYAGATGIDFGEFYIKPSVTVTDWLTLSAAFYATDNWAGGGTDAYYYSGKATVTLPVPLPMDIEVGASGEIGFQDLQPLAGTDYTHWNLGLFLTYKVFTLDFRYHDTDLNVITSPGQCVLGTVTICDEAFVVSLSASIALSDIK